MTTQPRQGQTGSTWFLPARQDDPVHIDIPGLNLDYAVVTRSGLQRLALDWDVPGTYILINPMGHAGGAELYVGKATGGLINRIRQHLRTREDWHRALLIRRPYQGFSSAEAAWLEGRLYDRLTAADSIRLTNGNRPSDETLPVWHRQNLEAVIPPTLSVLIALGVRPDAPDLEGGSHLDEVLEGDADISFAALVEQGVIRQGAALRPVSRAHNARATVGQGGKILLDGREFDSPSAAGSAVAQHNVNGWEFWGVISPTGHLTPLKVLRAMGAGAALPVNENSAQRTAGSASHMSPESRVRDAQRDKIQIFDLIRASLLSAGDVLNVTYKGIDYFATVQANGYLTTLGKAFPSPTAAAVAITGGNVNGWRFWRTSDGVKIDGLRDRAVAKSRH